MKPATSNSNEDADEDFTKEAAKSTHSKKSAHSRKRTRCETFSEELGKEDVKKLKSESDNFGLLAAEFLSNSEKTSNNLTSVDSKTHDKKSTDESNELLEGIIVKQEKVNLLKF